MHEPLAVMPKAICTICGERMDRADGFYKSNLSTYKECWKHKCSEINRGDKNQIIFLLTQILEEQMEIKEEVTSRMEDIEVQMKAAEGDDETALERCVSNAAT